MKNWTSHLVRLVFVLLLSLIRILALTRKDSNFNIQCHQHASAKESPPELSYIPPLG